MILLFWISLAAVAGTYFAYPLLLAVLRPFGRRTSASEITPSTALVVSAYNERDVIGEKLENALSLDYPADKLQVAVLSDASDDGTDEIVESYRDRRVTLYRQSERRGKSAALTRFVPQIPADIVVFSDANSLYASDALKKLVRHFEDPSVGYVVGHQRYYDEDKPVATSESLYWRYETWLKRLESQLSSVVGGDGAIMAIRSDLFKPLRDDDINDFVMPLRIVVDGFRGVFDDQAVCLERTANDFGGEFRRKVRIVTRSFRAVFRVPEALNPIRVGFFALQLWVHKVLRWCVPVFLLLMLVSCTVLALQGSGLYVALLGVQLAFYALATLGWVPRLKNIRPVYVAYYFCLVNVAAGLGIMGALTGKKFVTWTPERSEQDQEVGSLRPLDNVTNR